MPPLLLYMASLEDAKVDLFCLFRDRENVFMWQRLDSFLLGGEPGGGVPFEESMIEDLMF